MQKRKLHYLRTTDCEGLLAPLLGAHTSIVLFHFMLYQVFTV